ncbi:MAG TPA: hypothetical protein VGE97_02460 [Nitrososphaera sp.]
METQQQHILTKDPVDFTKNWTQEQLERQHELIRDYGPKEVSYCASFDAKDFDVLVKLSEAIHALNRIQDDNYLSKYFFDQLERKYNDHPTFIESNNQKAEIDQVSRTEDIPTIHGLAWNNKLILQGSTAGPFARWHYVAVGSDDREARAYHQQLFAEVTPRANMFVPAEGSISTSGQSLRFIGIFPTTFPTITVRESAVTNQPSGTAGTFFNRNEFSGNPISHTVNGQVFTIGTLINLVPVTRWG